MSIGSVETIDDVFLSFIYVMAKTIVVMVLMRITGQEVDVISSVLKDSKVKLVQMQDLTVQEETQPLISEPDHQVKNLLQTIQMKIPNQFSCLRICSKSII